MNNKINTNRLTLSLTIVSIFIFSSFTASTFAIGTALEATETMDTMDTLQGAQSKSRPPRKSQNKRPEKRLPQKEDVVVDPARETFEQYEEIISLLNTGQTLPPQVNSNLLEQLKKRQSIVGRFDLNILSQHYILTAWANYFNNDINRAQQAARLVYKKNPLSKDAQLTHYSISLLAGIKPSSLPRDIEYNQIFPKMLNLDTSRLETGLIGINLKEMNLNCLNSTTLEYKYGNSGICILLWKLKADSPTPQPHVDSMPPENSTRPVDPNGFGGSFAPTVAKTSGPAISDFDAFKTLFASTFAMSDTKFVAINMDTAQSKPDVLAAILKNSWPWAHVMISDPSSGASQFEGVVVEKNKPILLVAGKDGKIKYAGPPAGFLAPIILRQISDTAGTRPSIPNIFSKKPQPDSPVTASSTTNQKQLFITDKLPVEMTSEDEFQADKLLKNAKMLIKSGSTYTTPKKGIELCRQIIKDYYGTNYANEARELLKTVPERYRRRYKITNEELGL